jgi:hypothetical protein
MVLIPRSRISEHSGKGEKHLGRSGLSRNWQEQGDWDLFIQEMFSLLSVM